MDIWKLPFMQVMTQRVCVENDQSQERKHLTFDPRLQSLKSQLERAGVEQLRERRGGRASTTQRRSRESAF